jgi:hypothetical protein
MKIRTEHQNLGAALMQIAEHDSFTAINPLRIRASKINNAFLINSDTCLFLKYGQEPKSTTGEYQFTFTRDQIAPITEAAGIHPKVFIGLVLVEDQEICGLNHAQLKQMIDARAVTAGGPEDNYTVLVTANADRRLRTYTAAANRRRVKAHDALVISRSRFPAFLFE